MHPEPKKREQKPKEKPFWECFDQFCSEAGEKNSWTPATQEKMDALKVDLQAFKKNLSFWELYTCCPRQGKIEAVGEILRLNYFRYSSLNLVNSLTKESHSVLVRVLESN